MRMVISSAGLILYAFHNSLKFVVHSLCKCCPLSRLCICKLARYSQENFVLATGKVREFYIVRLVGTLNTAVTVWELQKTFSAFSQRSKSANNRWYLWSFPVAYILLYGQLIRQATTIYVSTEKLACSKSATPKHILGVALYNCYASGVAGVLAPPPMVLHEYLLCTQVVSSTCL